MNPLRKINFLWVLSWLILLSCNSSPTDKPIEDKPNNLAPNTPSSPLPSDNDSTVDPATQLKWTGGAPNNEAVLYDVYFGEMTPPSKKIAADAPNTQIQLDSLLVHEKTYLWQVVAKSSKGNSIGPIWKFKTRKHWIRGKWTTTFVTNEVYSSTPITLNQIIDITFLMESTEPSVVSSNIFGKIYDEFGGVKDLDPNGSLLKDDSVTIKIKGENKYSGIAGVTAFGHKIQGQVTCYFVNPPKVCGEFSMVKQY